jgi:hypothetical protein
MTATGTRFFAIAAAAILFAVAAPAGAAERQTGAGAYVFAAAAAAIEAAVDPALDAPRPTPQRAAGCAMSSQRLDGKGCANGGGREHQVRAVRA